MVSSVRDTLSLRIEKFGKQTQQTLPPLHIMDNSPDASNPRLCRGYLDPFISINQYGLGHVKLYITIPVLQSLCAGTQSSSHPPSVGMASVLLLKSVQ